MFTHIHTTPNITKRTVTIVEYDATNVAAAKRE